ncbi:GNAT family N-acetyltransferase [Planobispora siamensis]|uniref:N-acetyltransferase n=1 Tax=Planobispora siamensis TaxID=936338 RepID=A0A8J3WLS8_9ACTN|nr:GNAT family N-acetyltransferase [Planobispora siamensis]GIH92822.1 N-acetyltransferase [Planobispora siamensis]
MRWLFTTDVTDFPAAAEGWLRRDPVRATVPLTVLARIRRGMWSDGVLLGWLVSGGSGREVRGVVLHTPPYPLLLSDLPGEAVAPLAEALRGRDLSGVDGPVPLVESFTAAWGRPERERMSMRLYRLGTLQDAAAAGTARLADRDDLDLVAGWHHAFFAEAEPSGLGDDIAARVETRIRDRELVLWEAAGSPVALAGFSTPIAGMSRIGPVYTPPGFRRRGYGAAATHAATRIAMGRGAEQVLLFTDLSNPTSNSIYQALGYRPVGDHAMVYFDQAGES